LSCSFRDIDKNGRQYCVKSNTKRDPPSPILSLKRKLVVIKYRINLKKLFSRLHEIFIGSNKNISIQLNDRIGPIDRHLTYEEPIDEYLRRRRFGEVVGGGTFQETTGEISGCDVLIELNSLGNNYTAIDLIISEIESLGAPKGSKVIFNDSRKEVSIGKLEGLAIYLDGETLPEEVYTNSDINFVLAELSSAIGYSGVADRNWQGAKETALYFYGMSFERMKESILPFVNSYPLCANARITQIA
jgi:hypothetical protein